MVTRYGMVEDLGYVAYEAQPNRFLDLPGLAEGGFRASPATQGRIDEAVRTIVMQAFERTSELLTRQRELLDRCAAALLERETLDGDALAALTAGLQKDAKAAKAE
jgi:cell division protease FtsH